MGNSHVLSLTVFVLIMNWIGCYLVDRNEEICKTNGCKRLAKIVKESIDETIDPCHDFYQFACGGYIKRHPLKNGQNDLNAIKFDMDRRVMKPIMDYLKKAKTDPNSPLIVQISSKAFDWCVTEKNFFLYEYECVAQLDKYGMGRWAEAYFYEHYVKEEALEDGKMMTEKIVIAYKELINEDKWVDEGTRSSLFRFLSKMTFTIGLGEPIWSADKLQRFAKIFTPYQAKSLDEYKKALDKFKPEQEFKGWDTETSLAADASNIDDGIIINLGDLQEPKYAPDYPIEWKYGSTGRTIGHEITHSFDPTIVMVHINFTGDDQKQYLDRALCVADHFTDANLTITDHGKNYTFWQNGTSTWGETVPDNMGLRVAFRAYQKEKKRLYGNQQSPRLPGLKKYSAEQLFFIGNANYFCGVESLAMIKKYQQNDGHPFFKIRVNEGMKDQQNFAKAFNCPLNSPMNPEKKCRVWRKRI